MDQTINGHDPSDENPVFLDGLNAVGGTGRQAGASISIHSGDMVPVKGNQPHPGAYEGLLFLDSGLELLDSFLIKGHGPGTGHHHHKEQDGQKKGAFFQGIRHV